MPLNPQAGGTERITSLVARGLTRLGHTCLGILEFRENSAEMYYDGQPVTDLPAFLRSHNVDIVINQIAYATWLLKAFLDRGGDQWRRQGGKIISCLHFDPRPVSLYHLYKTKRDKRPADYVALAKSLLLYPYYRHKSHRQAGETFNWIYDNSDRFVTLSETHFPFIKEVTRRADYDRLTAINNPLTFDDISTDTILAEKENIILVCSRMDEYQKRVSLSLQAWKRIQNHPAAKDWRLVIVGTGPDLDSYKHYAERHALKRVTFEGLQDPEPYYRKADILLMTSIGLEGWGLTLTESLQRGVVPVVMNTAPVYADIIDHCYNGYLTKAGHQTRRADLAHFTRHLLTLIEDAPRLRSMQRNALASASRFTLPATMARWLPLLSSFNPSPAYSAALQIEV